MSNYRIISIHKLCYVDAQGNPVGDTRQVATNIQVRAISPKDDDVLLALQEGALDAAEKLKPLTPEMRPDALDTREQAIANAQADAERDNAEIPAPVEKFGDPISPEPVPEQAEGVTATQDVGADTGA